MSLKWKILYAKGYTQHCCCSLHNTHTYMYNKTYIGMYNEVIQVSLK